MSASLPIAVVPDREDPVAKRLKAELEGEVRFDRLARALYATDASIYEIVPRGVVFPRHKGDVATAINICREEGVSIVARGAGTGLTGGAVGSGVQLDLSRHMNRILSMDPASRLVVVEPGVVLDELNAALAPHRLHFAPDVATSSRATIGGMIANNSCGANSIVHGRTVDHVLSLTTVLSSGEVATFTACTADSRNPESASAGSPTVQSIRSKVASIRDANFEEIQRRFPKVMRSNGGYGLDRLGPPGTPPDLTKILCGSEGTLAVIVEAKLRLTPLPAHKGLIVLHFQDLIDALRATPAILTHQPSAVELIDDLIVNAGRQNVELARRLDFLQGKPAALLVVEFFAHSLDELRARLDRLSGDLAALKRAYAATVVVEPRQQADVWKLRTSGLGLLMSRPGDEQPYSFIEDTAVEPAKLADYISRMRAILDQEHVHAGYYAHASVGCIHVKPVLNLKRADHVEKLRRIAGAVADLALQFGGAFTGEHGDGIVRSYWLEKMYGSRITQAFREVKRAFDPHNLLNPHKIVDPLPMTENLRYGPGFRALPVKSYFDYGEYGGLAGVAGMCSGVGQCRQRLIGAMCPSYMATGSELHSTRARANALRLALSNRGLLAGLDDPALDEVMDLCISCKACKTECPTGVDMARLKAEFLAYRNLTRGTSLRARWIAQTPRMLEWTSRFPRLTNSFAQRFFVRWLLEQKYGLDRRLPPPRLARHTFRSWWKRHCRERRVSEASQAKGQHVVYFVDTWTNYIAPQAGIAAVRLLEKLGFQVACPTLNCCGRTAISQGLLGEAREIARRTVDALEPWITRGYRVVGTEPSCLLTLVDEYPQLLGTRKSMVVAENSTLLETLIGPMLPPRKPASGAGRRILYHGHCHQKALVGTSQVNAILRSVFGEGASEINSGCCGMAGSFGHEREHYDIARAIGEQRLFPAIRSRRDADIAVSGFSCRQQIEHHTGAPAKHWVEYVAEELLANVP